MGVLVHVQLRVLPCIKMLYRWDILLTQTELKLRMRYPYDQDSLVLIKPSCAVWGKETWNSTACKKNTKTCTAQFLSRSFSCWYYLRVNGLTSKTSKPNPTFPFFSSRSIMKPRKWKGKSIGKQREHCRVRPDQTFRLPIVRGSVCLEMLLPPFHCCYCYCSQRTISCVD